MPFVGESNHQGVSDRLQNIGYERLLDLASGCPVPTKKAKKMKQGKGLE